MWLIQSWPRPHEHHNLKKTLGLSSALRCIDSANIFSVTQATNLHLVPCFVALMGTVAALHTDYNRLTGFSRGIVTTAHPGVALPRIGVQYATGESGASAISIEADETIHDCCRGAQIAECGSQ